MNCDVWKIIIHHVVSAFQRLFAQNNLFFKQCGVPYNSVLIMKKMFRKAFKLSTRWDHYLKKLNFPVYSPLTLWQAD